MFAGARQLEGVPFEEALERWHNELEFKGLAAPGKTEEICVADSLGRVTAQSIMAKRPSPHYYAASLDGLAVKSTMTFGATPDHPVRVKLGVDGNFVDTGSPLPSGTDTVVPLTEVQFVNAEEVDVLQPSVPWRYVSPAGEDMEAAEVIVPNHRRVRPVDIGSMLRGGVTKVTVRTRPRIGILPVGSHLVAPGQEPSVGQRTESQSSMLAARCVQLGAEPVRFDIVPERLEDVTASLQGLEGLDALVILSGRSHGTALPAAWIQGHGSLILFGAAIKPGQSVTLGIVGTVPVIGLPAHAVSAYITFDLFVRPVIARRQGYRESICPRLKAVLGQTITSPVGTDEFLRVTVSRVDEQSVAIPISRGADIMSSLARASGILHVPSEVEGIPDGTTVDVELLEAGAGFEGALLVMGTYDPAFELLRNAIVRRFPDVSVQSANVGSRGGIRALRKGYAHVAGLHLFDDASGTYNVPFVRSLAEEMPIVLVNFFRRYLGFIVKKGNPKNIQTFADLTKPDVTFINRQHGAGTRVLIDHYLRRSGIDAAHVKGYQTETYTHMSLAATVASGGADVGVGIATVARPLDLDFVPIIAEQLDLAVPRRFLKTYPLQCLLNVLRSADFKSELDVLPHYDTQSTGQVLFEGGA